MPIRPEDRARYGADWPELSRRLRFERAGGRCECDGRCAWIGHPGKAARCEARHGQPHPFTTSKVVLTVAHLDQVPENRNESEMMVMCQGCHLAYDRDQHKATRARRQAEAAPLLPGIDTGPDPRLVERLRAIRAEDGRLTVQKLAEAIKALALPFWPTLAGLEAQSPPLVKRGLGKALRDEGFDPEGAL